MKRSKWHKIWVQIIGSQSPRSLQGSPLLPSSLVTPSPLPYPDPNPSMLISILKVSISLNLLYLILMLFFNTMNTGLKYGTTKYWICNPSDKIWIWINVSHKSELGNRLFLDIHLNSSQTRGHMSLMLQAGTEKSLYFKKGEAWEYFLLFV